MRQTAFFGFAGPALPGKGRGRRNPSVPLLFQMMELLDFSVDALVFSQGEGEPVLHTQGLSPREVEALSRLIAAMRERE